MFDSTLITDYNMIEYITSVDKFIIESLKKGYNYIYVAEKELQRKSEFSWLYSKTLLPSRVKIDTLQLLVDLQELRKYLKDNDINYKELELEAIKNSIIEMM